jgi:hypothetical protein
MSTDIIARLQLRADQFSSENARAFADLRQRATSTAQEIRGTWSSALTDVQRLAQSALDVGPTKSGGLDLTGEIARLAAAAQAADRKAAALRLIEEASHRVAFAEGAATEKELQRADAARVSALMEEENAGQIRARIAALHQLQVELDQVAGATGHGVEVGKQAHAVTGQQRQSMIMLGQQFQDFAVQVGSGQSITTAFAQQIGQAGFALQGMGGRLAGVSAFLGSFGGILTMTAVVGLTPLVSKLLEQNDALGDAEKKLRDDAAASDIAEQAKKRFAKTAEGVVAAINEQRRALDDSIKAEFSAAEQANITAKKNLEHEISIRRTTAALLEQAQAEAEVQRVRAQAPGQRGELATLGLDVAVNRAAGLQARLKANDAAIRTALRNLNDTRVVLGVEQGKRANDPVAQINRQYDQEVHAAERAARGNDRLTASISQQVAAIERRREAALKAERDRQAAEHRAPTADRQTGRQIDLAEARQIVASIGGVVTSGLRTIDEQRKLYEKYRSGTGPLAARPGTSDHEPGLAIDIAKGPGITLAAVRKAFQDRGVALSQLLDEGRHIHAAFGRKGSAGDIASARAAQLKDEMAAAEKARRANEQLETSLDRLAKRYDPLASAARVYRDELGEIFRLVAAGKLTEGEGFDYAMRARQQAVATRGQDFDQAFRETIGGDAIAKAVEDLNSGILSGAELWANRLELGAIGAGEALAGAVGNIGDLFGLRFSGPLSRMLRPGGIAGQSAETAQLIAQTFKATGVTIAPASIDKLSSALAGAAMGQIGGSVFSSITGSKQSKFGSAMGGVVGEMAGKAVAGTITKVVGGKLGSMLGNAAGPIGAALGGALGGVLGGLFSRTPRGAAVITSATGAAALSGDRNVTEGLSGSAKSVQTAIRRIADAFGAEIGAFSVSIGKGKNNFRVSSTGSSQVGAKNPRNASIIYDGADEATAILVATQDAIRDGAIKVGKTAQRVLALGNDLDAAISKAMLIESVPRDLKALLDPVGAAVDDLNRKFRKTVAALQEGGASAEEMAQAEQLYNLQLQQVKTSTASASASLKTFLTDLKLGGNSPYSYRDQEATALAQLKPYLDQIDAGQRVDQEKYQSAARAYLDVERELYGSTSKYFDAQALIQAATAKAIETIDNAVPISAGVESPFAKATADSAAKTAANTQTGNELLEQLSDQMGDVRALLERLSATGGTVGGFVGTDRAFVNAA